MGFSRSKMNVESGGIFAALSHGSGRGNAGTQPHEDKVRHYIEETSAFFPIPPQKTGI
jgi:hypothetical protein